MKWKIITAVHLLQWLNYVEALVPVPFERKKPKKQKTVSYIFVSWGIKTAIEIEQAFSKYSKNKIILIWFNLFKSSAGLCHKNKSKQGLDYMNWITEIHKYAMCLPK